MRAASPEAVWEVLDTVLDPEVPALSVVDLGLVRDVRLEGDAVTVVITPTYSGCPATQVIADDIAAALRAHGWADVRVETTFTPPWTTDWMTEAGKAKLRAYGIAPPGPVEPDEDVLVPLLRRRASIECPYCGSRATELRSEFGATACKAIWFCTGCTQPFEEFKAI